MAVAHAIHEEFPRHANRIRQLKMTEGRCARLLQEHDEINDQGAGAESRGAPMPFDAKTDIHKRCAMLRDEIARANSGD